MFLALNGRQCRTSSKRGLAVRGDCLVLLRSFCIISDLRHPCHPHDHAKLKGTKVLETQRSMQDTTYRRYRLGIGTYLHVMVGS